MNLIEHFIDGKIVSASSDRKGKVFNPATGKQESEVRLASKSDLDLAVEKAKNMSKVDVEEAKKMLAEAEAHLKALKILKGVNAYYTNTDK